MPKRKSNSNILKCIILCLEEERFPHVLYWHDRRNMKFTVILIHKNNPGWNTSYLDLFVELDKLSPKKNYFTRPDYIKECKVRCKSNLKKLCKEGVLVRIPGEEKKFDNSKFSRCYQIKDPMGVYGKLLTGRTVVKNADQEEKVAGEDIQKAEKCVETVFSQSSHYPCLSAQNITVLAPACGIRLESFGISIIGENGEVYEDGKNLSECGSKQIAQSIMNTFDVGIQNSNGEVYEDGKNLSKCGSEQIAQSIMDTDVGIQKSYRGEIPMLVGETSFYSSDLIYSDAKDDLSYLNSARAITVKGGEYFVSPEKSYPFWVNNEENVGFYDDDAMNKLGKTDYDNLDNVYPFIGLLNDADPWLG